MKNELYPDQEEKFSKERVPIFAENPVRKFRNRSGQAIVVELVVIDDTEFADRRDRVQGCNSVKNC